MSQVIHLQPFQISWRPGIPYRRKDGPVGLKNLGNTCYFNSVLQCLTYTPPLANLCLQGLHSSQCGSRNDKSSSNCAFCCLEKRIKLSLTIDHAVDSPSKILDYLQRSTKLFRVGRQEDAHELLRYAIEACNTACIQLQKPLAATNRVTKLGNGKPKEEPPNVVKEIFGGVLQSQVKCLACGAESNKLDDIMDLSLDIMPRLVSVKESMCRFFQSEVLDGDNKYQCSKCKKPTTARKQLSVFKAPNVLVIQLKRFENIYGGKIDRHITFEERLCLAGLMCRNSKDARPNYSLYGVVVHSGHSQDGGHYYAYVKEPRGKWYCCNDASVCEVNCEDVRADKAYILFYVRSNRGPEVSSAARSDSTPSPPTTPDTDLKESSKKYSSTISSPTHSKSAKSTLVNNRGISKKQMRFKIRKGSDRPEKSWREEQYNKLSNEDASSTCDGVPKQMDSNSTAQRSHEGLSIPMSKQEATGSCDFSSSSPRCGCDGNSHPKVSSGDRVVENRAQNGALIVDCIANTGFGGEEVRGNSSVISVGAESGGASGERPSVVGSSSAEDATKSFLEVTRHAGTKRPRDEVQCSTVVVEGPQSTPLLDDAQVSEAMIRQELKSVTGDDRDQISRFKSLLEKEAREELLDGGWGDEVRERLRAVKRLKKLHGLWPPDAAKQVSLGRQIFAEERECCKNLVPKVLKERLVEHLKSYFCQKPAK